MSQRFRAWTLLAAFTAAVLLPFASPRHFFADDDSACGQLPVAVGSSPTRVTAVQHDGARQHCAFCHWQRAVGGATPALPVASFASPLCDLVRPLTASGLVLAAVGDDRPSRAPPALLLS